MKICGRGIKFLQIIDREGTVRICGWMRHGGEVIGKLSESSLYDIYHGKRLQEIVEQLSKGDYSNCDIDACHLLANGRVEEQLIEMDHLPEYPDELYLAFEQTCNYRCPSCTMHKSLEYQKSVSEDLEKDYKLIEERIADVLPHLRMISANGLGELFTSPHIMNILANWKPLRPKEEIVVQLETNGSLFNEANWKKIENLGQYDLRVSVTVMSFDEKTYQILSGTKLPIENIRSNLRFISDLRKKGIINYFELATVYQERNFRTLPDFVREGLEYEPDYIRLRPYAPWGNLEREVEWFSDVRGKYHPYHEEFLEIMKDPIFKDPRVHDWAGGRESETNDFRISELRCKTQEKSDVLTKLITDDGILDKIIEEAETGVFSVYGAGNVGRALVHLLKDRVRVECIIDRTAHGECEGVKIVNHARAEDSVKNGTVILTVMYDKDELTQDLRKLGYCGKILDIRDLLCEQEKEK